MQDKNHTSLHITGMIWCHNTQSSKGQSPFVVHTPNLTIYEPIVERRYIVLDPYKPRQKGHTIEVCHTFLARQLMFFFLSDFATKWFFVQFRAVLLEQFLPSYAKCQPPNHQFLQRYLFGYSTSPLLLQQKIRALLACTSRWLRSECKYFFPSGKFDFHTWSTYLWKLRTNWFVNSTWWTHVHYMLNSHMTHS